MSWPRVLKGKYGGAEPLYHREMQIIEATLGKDHPEYSMLLNNMAALLLKQVGSRLSGCSPGTFDVVFLYLDHISGAGLSP